MEELKNTDLENDSIIGRVYETVDYNKFKFIEENRTAKERQKLKNSIKLKGIISPIIVDENFYIIDGQHRFLAARAVNKPIIYTVKKWSNYQNDEIDTLINVNTTGSNWKFKDYVDAYSKIGKTEYIRLQNLIEQFHGQVSPRTIAALGDGINEGAFKNNKVQTAIHNGTFEFYNYHGLLGFLNHYVDMVDYANEFMSQPTKPNEKFILAYFQLYACLDVNLKKLDKSIYRDDLLVKCEGIENSSRITDMMIQTYNKKTKKTAQLNPKYDFFQGRQTTHVDGRMDYSLVRPI